MAIAIVVVVLILVWAAFTYNGLVTNLNKIDEAFATMDVYLKKRFDLIPNLVSTVKGYATHEVDTLEKIVAARNSAVSIEDQLSQESKITASVAKVFALAEQYPELKANENFVELQRELTAIEDDIANSRKYYNGCVREFNDKVVKIPSNIIASLCKFTKKPMYEVEDSVERQNVKVEF